MLRKKHSWDPEDLALLGKMSDYKIAEKIGLDRRAVTTKRESLGIPGFQRHKKWRDDEIAFLGAISDCELAELLEVPEFVVRYARSTRGIPALRRDVWADVWASQFGSKSDTEIAAAAGVSVASVVKQRRKRGIPPLVERWFEGNLDKLGTQSDSQIAKQLGVGLHAVQKVRKAHGILAHTKRHPWRPEEIALLGKLSDAEVARRTGRTKSGVAVERTNRRIRGIDPRLAPTLNRLAKEGKI